MAKNEHINLIEYLDIAELPEGDQAGYIRQFTTIILDGAIEELASGLNKSEAKILEKLPFNTTYLQTAHGALTKRISEIPNDTKRSPRNSPHLDLILNTHFLEKETSFYSTFILVVFFCLIYF